MNDRINLGRVMAIVSQAAHRARQDDLEDAQAGVKKQTATRQSVKAKLKQLKKSDASLDERLDSQWAGDKIFQSVTFGIFGGDERREVPKELAKNAQSRKVAQQLDVDAEEQLAELQQDIRDVSESFEDSNEVVNGIQAELSKLDQAAFDLG